MLYVRLEVIFHRMIFLNNLTDVAFISISAQALSSHSQAATPKGSKDFLLLPVFAFADLHAVHQTADFSIPANSASLFIFAISVSVNGMPSNKNVSATLIQRMPFLGS
jgi:hypothetical protein